VWKRKKKDAKARRSPKGLQGVPQTFPRRRDPVPIGLNIRRDDWLPGKGGGNEVAPGLKGNFKKAGKTYPTRQELHNGIKKAGRGKKQGWCFAQSKLIVIGKRKRLKAQGNLKVSKGGERENVRGPDTDSTGGRSLSEKSVRNPK